MQTSRRRCRPSHQGQPPPLSPSPWSESQQFFWQSHPAPQPEGPVAHTVDQKPQDVALGEQSSDDVLQSSVRAKPAQVPTVASSRVPNQAAQTSVPPPLPAEPAVPPWPPAPPVPPAPHADAGRFSAVAAAQQFAWQSHVTPHPEGPCGQIWSHTEQSALLGVHNPASQAACLTAGAHVPTCAGSRLALSHVLHPSAPALPPAPPDCPALPPCCVPAVPALPPSPAAPAPPVPLPPPLPAPPVAPACPAAPAPPVPLAPPFPPALPEAPPVAPAAPAAPLVPLVPLFPAFPALPELPALAPAAPAEEELAGSSSLPEQPANASVERPPIRETTSTVEGEANRIPWRCDGGG